MCTKHHLWICGDIHGELSNLVWKASHQLKIRNADILVVGDFGAGFGRPKSMDVAYAKICTTLVENDICLYTIRGNHDDPSFFDGSHDYERLHFLPDHRIVELCGKKIYPIGGAVSTDIDLVDPLTRKSRRMQNDALVKFGSSKRIWWPDEAPSKALENIPKTTDIIVSHEAPLSFEPSLTREAHVRDDTWQKVVESRRYLDDVLKAVLPPRWFYGHYHCHFEGNFQGTHYRCLDIAEMTQIC
ncbi:metallophosphoesterase family protein [Fibrobacter intestinalis]|uniref:Calcineurin-like phosphoesterase n=1 Tax=Fibrobacter intestinalis TaxID=28122 RepID=A0A1T4KD52_9BACT|nr:MULTISPECIES: metallophosphoesterase [Fibrobacter]PBC73856.1 calcineurin-like phosphoesterase family protein [Fibrobacter sp. NR9]SJZ40339.1 Calcineurin-like phosphoesterase [Fibrobacter intestinalis]